MKLVIISHTEHYQKDGKIFGWGATVREIDQLSKIFSRVIHVAPLYGDEKPNSALEYQSYNVKLVPVTPSGGNRVLNKLRVFFFDTAIRKSHSQRN